MAPVNVEIEYCGGWGYAPRYRELANMILAEIPSANVTGKVGRRTSFEVKVNGVLVHSKLSTMAFPDFPEVVKVANEANKGEAPQQITKHEKGCIIL